jgi:hypothetical protein
MGVVKKMQIGSKGFDAATSLLYFHHHPHPTANAATFPARGKAEGEAL